MAHQLKQLSQKPDGLNSAQNLHKSQRTGVDISLVHRQLNWLCYRSQTRWNSKEEH